MDKPSGERVKSQPAHRKKERQRTSPTKREPHPDQAGSPDEQNGQRKLNDFGMRCQGVQFVVMSMSTMMGLNRPEDRAAYVFCSHSCKRRHGRMSGCAKFVGDLRRAGE